MTLLIVAGFLTAQPNGWSTPVPIDSTKDIGRPIMAVSSKGQIAVIGGGSRLSPCPLYISDDNGKSFQLRYRFKPPTIDYEIWYPNGIAYDSNNVLWVYWAWDECSDNDCTFVLRSWLYLSRSTDGGKTFEHVLKMKRGFHMGLYAEHEQWMAIGKDNTIHLLRDTAWYNSDKKFTEFNLIYTKLPGGDWTKRQDFSLPQVSYFVELANFNFTFPSDENPVVTIHASTRNATFPVYWNYTKFKHNQFLPYVFIDSLQFPTSGNTNVVNNKRNEVYLNYYIYKIDSNIVNYFTKVSSNYGETFDKSVQTSMQTYYISQADSNHLYSITYQSILDRIKVIYIWKYL